MRRPVVVRVISDLPVGGVERKIVDLLPRLQKWFDVRVCCIREKGELARELEKVGIPVDLCYFTGRLSPTSLMRMARYLKSVKAAIVHTHMYRSNVSGIVAAKLAGVPVTIASVHTLNEWDSWRQRKMDAFTARFRDATVAVSEEVLRYYVEATGVNPERCHVIYNGVDVDEFSSPSRSASQIRADLGIGEKNRVVGKIARLHPVKDHETFLKAAAEVLREVPDTVFLVVGKGPLLGELRRLADRLGIAGRVVFTGNRSDIPDILSILDVSVICSKKEGFNNVVLESMAAGVPMVATNVGGNREVVVDGETGFLVPPGDSAGVAQAVVRILQSDSLASRMSAAARERARLFDINEMAEKVADLYNYLLKKKGLIYDTI